MEYKRENLKTVGILGHLGCGKTSLAESLLFQGKSITQKGEVEKKNTISDYLDEEQNKQTSFNTSILPVYYHDFKINFLDTPGSDEFEAEINYDLAIMDAAILVLDATKGVEVGTVRIWRKLIKKHIPTMIYVNKMDKENVKFENVLEDIRQKLGKKAVPFCWPIGREKDFQGFVNVLEMKARLYNESIGKCQDAEIWEEKRPKIEELRTMINESVAETDEALLDKYFMGEELTEDEIREGLKTGVSNGDLMPVLVGSAIKNIGVNTLLKMIVNYLPNEKNEKMANTLDNNLVEVKPEDPFSAIIFKTIVDPFLGTINIFKVISGSIEQGQDVYVPNVDQTIKINLLFTLMGKMQFPVQRLNAGDIGMFSKINLETGFTLCDSKRKIIFDKVKIPLPTMYLAIEPEQKKDEDKMSQALAKMLLEDPSLEIKRNSETAQLLIGGQGLTELGFVFDKMKRIYKVNLKTDDPKVVYRETIKKMTSAQGKYKKQSGGAGQYGDVWIRFEPSENEFEFQEEVFGGSVPKNYFPAVEKGLRETFVKGPLAGYPVINVKATLYDGSYHPVDSSELAFKMAASLAFKEATKTCKPTILEPIIKVEVLVSSEYIGDIIGDLNKRRGRVLGMEPLVGEDIQLVTALVPEAEILKYTIDLKALTQGNGHFRRYFDHYEEVPEYLIDKIVQDSKMQGENSPYFFYLLA